MVLLVRLRAPPFLLVMGLVVLNSLYESCRIGFWRCSHHHFLQQAIITPLLLLVPLKLKVPQWARLVRYRPRTNLSYWAFVRSRIVAVDSAPRRDSF